MDCLKSKLRWVALSALLAPGCGGVTDSESTDAASNETAADEAQLGECDQLEQTQVAVVTEMWFARISDDGFSVGADLDQETGGCGVEDLDNPQGVSGVDNSFGTLIPILELTEGAAIEVYIQNLINNGEVLIMVEMEDVDDAENDLSLIHI